MTDSKHKKLYRSPKDGLVFGIAAGMARYFEVDPVFVRLVWIALSVLMLNLAMPVLYIALFIVLPVDPSQDTVAQHQEPKDVTEQK